LLSWERAAHAAQPYIADLPVNPKQNDTVSLATVASTPVSLRQTESTSAASSSALELVVVALIAKGTASDISAQLPGDSSIADSCTVLQQQANEADVCTRLDSRESLLIILCSRHGNTESTLLIYRLSPAGLDAGLTQPSGLHNIYRVRVVGQEVLQPAVNYCGNVAVAAFKVGYPGHYHLEVLQLYQGFSYAAPTFGIADIHAAYHTFNTTMTGVTRTPAAARPCHLQPYPASEAAVQAGGLQVNSSSLNPATVAASSVSTTVDDIKHLSSIASSNDSCPICRGPNHRGRWVVRSGANTTLLANVQQGLQRTCTFNSSLSYDTFFGCSMGMLPAVVPEAEDHPVLEWAPYDCRCVLLQYYHTVLVAHWQDTNTKIDVGVSIAALKQSSFLRHLHLFCHFCARKHDMFQPIHLANAVAARQQDTSNCSHVFVNFGHWPLRLAQSQPWDAGQYAQQVRELAKSMHKQQKRHGNRQFWLTIQPTAVMTSQQPGSNVTLASGWRTDPFILLFNKVASTMMKAYGIPTVDIYSIATPLFDMSYDATHYIGTVGLAQAEMVANIVCDDVLVSQKVLK
jgi:hypothetical protein